MRPRKVRSIDWTRQDVSIADELGVSRERIRQLRVQAGAPKALFHKRERHPRWPRPRRIKRPIAIINPLLWMVIFNVLSQSQTEKDKRQKDARRAAGRIQWEKRKHFPIHKEQRKIWATRRARAKGVRSKEEYLSSVRKSPAHHRANNQRLKRLAALRNPEHFRRKLQERHRRKMIRLGLAPWYKPEPRGQDGKIPKHTRQVIAARRREYIEWWRPIYRERRNQWKLERWESMRRAGQRQLGKNIRNGLKRFIRGRIGTATSELIGCSLAELKLHLERQFRPGWSWENYGRRWNIDHLVPLAKFDLSQESHVKLSCHYTNLRPLACWANSRKSDRLIRKAMQPCLPI